MRQYVLGSLPSEADSRFLPAAPGGLMKELVREKLGNTLAVISAVAENDGILETLVAAAEATAKSMLAGGKLLAAGNGGSAADAQHLVAEFVGRLTVTRPAMRAIALTTDSSIMTAVGNDFGFERVFERQIEALGQAGDVFLGISTSGNSPNILCALERSRSMGMPTFGMSGGTGGRMAELCDFSIVVPSKVTMNIQETHLALEHIYCMLVERYYFGAEEFAVRYEGAKPGAVLSGRV